MKLSYAIIIALSAIVSSLPTLEASDGLAAQPALSDSEVIAHLALEKRQGGRGERRPPPGLAERSASEAIADIALEKRQGGRGGRRPPPGMMERSDEATTNLALEKRQGGRGGRRPPPGMVERSNSEVLLSDEREVAVEEGEEAVDVPPAQWSRDPVPKLQQIKLLNEERQEAVEEIEEVVDVDTVLKSTIDKTGQSLGLF